MNFQIRTAHPRVTSPNLVRAAWMAATLVAAHPAASGAGFEVKPLQPFFESRCVSCHDAAEKKGGLDLDALKPDLADEATRAKWTLIFDRVQRGEMPPKKKPRPSTPELRTFLTALGGPLVAHDTAAQAAGRTVLRRLNRVEYENTLHDLLGIDAPLREILPEDSITAGFDNVGAGLRLSTMQMGQYLAAADAALDAALRLTNAPAVVKRAIDFPNDPVIKAALSVPTGGPRPQDPTRKHVQNYRVLPDGFVSFTGGLGLPGARASVAGRYRLRLKGQPYQCDDRDLTWLINIVNVQQIPRLAAYYTFAPGQTRDIELEVKLERNEGIVTTLRGVGYDKDGKRMSETNGGETFQGAGFKFISGEFEGPLIEAWPPAGVGKVFGDLPVKRIEKVRDNDRNSKAYEIVSANPAEDAKKVITGFANRAFRRPASSEAITRYTKLVTDALADGATFENAVRIGCKAVLTSPEFLFFAEERGRLDDYALATRLSYFLWSTMPDEELLKLAAAKKLSQPATLRAQTERLLNDPRALAFTRNFTGQWLDLRQIDATVPDARLYPDYDEMLKDAMVQETEAFFAEVLRANLPAANFIHSDFTMLNRRLADHYGIAGVTGETVQKVALKPEHKRGGLLTQASILKVTANGTTSSPVLRGVWMLKHLLGTPPNPPPADVGAVEPDTRGTTTIREQLAKHSNQVSCAGCHQYIDPPGFALESYDVIGGFRDRYRSGGAGDAVNLLKPDGLKVGYKLAKPVDASGEMADGRKFSGLDEFKKLLLSQQDQIVRGFLKNLVTYATGASVSFADRNTVEAILAKTKPQQFPVRTLVHEVVQSPLFQTK